MVPHFQLDIFDVPQVATERQGIWKEVRERLTPLYIAATEAQPSSCSKFWRLRWRGELLDAIDVASAEEISEREGIERSRVNDLLRLRLLPPEVVQAIADGAQPRTQTLEWPIRHPISADWERQRRNFEAHVLPRPQ